MKIIAVILSYYPQESFFKQNIESIIGCVDKVLVWENTPNYKKNDYRYIQNDKIEYHGDGINSISHGLNYCWHYAEKNEYDYLLIMDQDSYWDDLSNYFGWTIYNSQAPEGIWGPEVIERQRENPVIQVNKVITSGMLVNLNLINKIGGWNEIFDIDCVDDEFCLRARQYGINTYLFSKCRLRHRFGEPKSVEILGHRGLLRNDPPQRLYSIYRNHIILMKLFPLERSLKTEFKEDWIDRIKWILIFEDKRLKKMIAIVRGIISGMFY